MDAEISAKGRQSASQVKKDSSRFEGSVQADRGGRDREKRRGDVLRNCGRAQLGRFKGSAQRRLERAGDQASARLLEHSLPGKEARLGIQVNSPLTNRAGAESMHVGVVQIET
jgi:hypothetical protein